MKRVLLVLVLAPLLVFLANTAFATGAVIGGGEAKALVQKGAVLVDVRTPEEFAASHLAGALNIPVQELDARKGELPKDKDIVVYCRSGARSARSRDLLQAAGFAKVYDLGAMSNWK
ncbi:MAG: rhodanese-like domain-containing protein [Myxococcaceae bacterium]|nr:rhodanese-like domain-containing protein [Myxococcaceae bacterium]